MIIHFAHAQTESFTHEVVEYTERVCVYARILMNLWKKGREIICSIQRIKTEQARWRNIFNME